MIISQVSYRTNGPLVISLVAKHKSGKLRCPATALIAIKLYLLADFKNVFRSYKDTVRSRS